MASNERALALASRIASGDAGDPRLARWSGRGNALDQLRREIAGEMASALSRAERRITDALDRLDELERAIETARGSAADELVDEFNATRRVAERRRWELMIQREALGIRRNDVLKRFYPIPARKRPSR